MTIEEYLMLVILTFGALGVLTIIIFQFLIQKEQKSANKKD